MEDVSLAINVNVIMDILDLLVKTLCVLEILSVEMELAILFGMDVYAMKDTLVPIVLRVTAQKRLS